jgi:hypothetical protein
MTDELYSRIVYFLSRDEATRTIRLLFSFKQALFSKFVAYDRKKSAFGFFTEKNYALCKK